MNTSTNILYPTYPRAAVRFGAPPIVAVIVYTVIRIIADSNNNGFIDWSRPVWLFALECGWTIVMTYLIHETVMWLRQRLYQKVYGDFSKDAFLEDAAGISQNSYLWREVRMIYLMTLFLVNALGLPFTALTDDGLSFFDGFVNNLIGLMVTTAYLILTRGRDYVRLLNQAELDIERYKNESATARLQALRSQLNPHFLFNSLNTLSSLVHRDAEAADDFIQQLAKVYRYVLEHSEHDTVTLHTELQFVASYLWLLQMRFKEGLRVEMRIDKTSEDLHLPPMTLQVLIENAVKHNIVSPKQPLTIEIVSDGEDCLVVKNNLQERSEKDASSSVGLANITARYEHLAQQTLTVLRTNDAFTVRVPLLRS
ncbi:MAG: histidine kinase [Ignavibacteria bacterium]|nr:histidine kinase [Ignavibacteria bacterium]